MPNFNPSRHDGQILDLETAAKGGVLGGGFGVVAAKVCGGGVGKVCGGKSDLKKMIKELESIDVPSVFICPISLEPMQDPVTLCTGQTYERFNILKWFSMGHLSCPTTMQELWDDSVTSNITLCQLSYIWFYQKYVVMKKRSEDVQGRAIELLETLKKVKGKDRVEALKELRKIVAGHESARRTMVKYDGIALISSLLGPFTSHAVGSESIGILVCLILGSEAKINLIQPMKVSLMVDMLNEGSIDTKINCTKLFGILIEGNDNGSEKVSSLSLLVGLLRLVKNKSHPNGVLACLSLLKLLCSNEAVKKSVIRIGSIPQLVELLPNLNAECVELAIHILEALTSLQEGTQALKDCSKTIPTTVKLLMRVSENCTRLALSILWAVCKLAPEECASIAVDAGLAAKLLLVIQSGCNSTLKQRAAELLKLCSLNYTDTTFISNGSFELREMKRKEREKKGIEEKRI